MRRLGPVVTTLPSWMETREGAGGTETAAASSDAAASGARGETIKRPEAKSSNTCDQLIEARFPS